MLNGIVVDEEEGDFGDDGAMMREAFRLNVEIKKRKNLASRRAVSGFLSPKKKDTSALSSALLCYLVTFLLSMLAIVQTSDQGAQEGGVYSFPNNDGVGRTCFVCTTQDLLCRNEVCWVKFCLNFKFKVLTVKKIFRHKF